MKKSIIILITLCSCQDVLFEEEPPNDPEGNFESMWSTFNEKYAVFEQRNVDWSALYDQYRPMISNTTSDDQLFDVITSLLSHLDDGHVSLMADGHSSWNSHQEFRDRSKFDLFKFETIRSQYLDGVPTIIDNQYAYSTIDNDIGYLWAALLSGSKPLFIDDFVQRMKDKKGIIIDLRHNDGGDFTNGEVIASRFASEKTLTFTGQAKSGPGPDDYEKSFDYFIEAGGPEQLTQPVVVLIDGYTVSAAENLTFYFRVLPQVTIIGSNTAGAMGERIVKEMPNGWNYSITGQIMTAADGIVYEGPGIPPDIYFENKLEYMKNGIDSLLITGVNYLKSQF